MEPTKAQLRLLHHTLGISDPYQCNRPPWRNHFIADEGHMDYPDLMSLVRQGLMVRNAMLFSGYLFTATEKGTSVAKQTRPQVSLEARVWRRYLRTKECMPELTFEDYTNSIDLSKE